MGVVETCFSKILLEEVWGRAETGGHSTRECRSPFFKKVNKSIIQRRETQGGLQTDVAEFAGATGGKGKPSRKGRIEVGPSSSP